MRSLHILSFVCLSLATAAPALAPAQTPPPGQVQLPLNDYNSLVDAGRDPKTPPRAAPSSYALGKATVNVTVDDAGTATVEASLTARVFDADWVLIPLLPAGTAVSNATVGGQPIQLVPSAEGLGWSVKEAGTFQVTLSYAVDAHASSSGMVVGIPVPPAASISLTASLTGTGLDATVIPAAGIKTTNSGDRTQVVATVPTTQGIFLSWRLPTDRGHVVSRASYKGSAAGNAVRWTAELGVELFDDATVELDLLDASVILSDVKVDGRAGTILTRDGQFATLVKGRGAHKIALLFEVPISRADGPPTVALKIPEIPVSRFELSLPGKKEVTVTPGANVTNTSRGGTTLASVNVPMTEEVRFSWAEAVPEEIRQELRATANLYHTVYAEEGVLYVTAMNVFEVSRGETNVIELAVPNDVQVNDVRAPDGGVSEWIPKRGVRGQPNTLSIFLDRQLKGEFRFDVLYERKLPGGQKPTGVEVPLLIARNVYRQRGMLALLSGKELTLKPTTESGVTRVGENQLPAFVRQAVDKTIAHTFKYLEDAPKLVVEPAEPERKVGKFDAQVDTLISLGDVTMKGTATVEVNVKSGGIMDLQLALPEGVNFLSLTAPSLRTHKLQPGEGEQLIDVHFTQEMEGQFRVDVAYEKIMDDKADQAVVPTVSVKGAEVEQGRIAVEALSAVEVQAGTVQQLSSLDISELPQQLILKTTNPILLAYKYVHVDPPYQLGLKVTRHLEIDVQAATIDDATYRTLYTRDGLAVTTAHFTVRNSRKQFLKVRLPEDSEVWSVFVAGKAEKPALVNAGEGEGGASVGSPNILIKIINSAEGFPVELIYATPVAKVGALGRVRGSLPRPDMVVTNSRWDVYLPDEISYGDADTNMDIIEEAAAVSGEDMRAEVSGLAQDGGGAQVVSPLRIDVPTSGIRYSFRKVYANRSDEEAEFAIPYASTGGAWFARFLALVGALALWLGIWMLAMGRQTNLAVGSAAVGVIMGAVAIGLFGTGTAIAVTVSILAAAAILGQQILLRVRATRGPATEPGTPPAGE